MNMTCKRKLYQKHGSTRPLAAFLSLLSIRAKWKLANRNNCLGINISSVITIFIYLISVMLQL